jgi:peptidoglycan/LPS O-acetylase OafA/YrhL
LRTVLWHAEDVKSRSSKVDDEASADTEPILRSTMPELDTIRGLAILGVLFYHGLYWARDFSPYTTAEKRFLSLISAGQFGVSLFFVLSGFLITGLLLDSRKRADYYKRFYIRRALRILPAYYGILLILLLTKMITNSFLWMSLIYCSNLSMLFGVAMSYPVLWSLAVEEHFYLIWPTAVQRRQPRTLMAVAGSIVLLAPAFRSICHAHATKTNFIGAGCAYYTWNAADGLALGALLALGVREFHSNRAHLLRMAVGCFLVAVLVTAAGYPFGITTRRTMLGEALQVTPWNFGFTGLLGLFLLVGTSRWKRLVTSEILLFFGRISYGLYLYHLLVFTAYDRFVARFASQVVANLSSWQNLWLRFTIVGLIAVVISYLSRRYFEEPFLRLKDRFTPAVS